MRGSLPRDTLMGLSEDLSLREANHWEKAFPMKKAMPGVRLMGSLGTPDDVHDGKSHVARLIGCYSIQARNIVI